jgi:hypothetical protein
MLSPHRFEDLAEPDRVHALLGSTAAAQKEMRSLFQIAKNTPFEFGGCDHGGQSALGVRIQR